MQKRQRVISKDWQKEMENKQSLASQGPGKYHESVMVDQVISALHICSRSKHLKKACKYIDATLGTGGHTLEILKLGGEVLGIDLDPKMVEMSRKRIGKEILDRDKYSLVNGNFTDIDRIAKENGFEKVSGILLDLGVSNLHLKDLERGFSFANREAPLDMRINPEAQGVKASDLLNILREDQLRNLFEVTIEPGPAKWISKKVTEFRKRSPILKVNDMLEICDGLRTGKHGLNEATLPFLALRIAVNSELENLKEVLPKAYNLLEVGGRLVVISFHSGEDKIVKDFMTGKGVSGFDIASADELEGNPRARSAKMRILEKK